MINKAPPPPTDHDDEPDVCFCALLSEATSTEGPNAIEIWSFTARLHRVCSWSPECLIIAVVLLVRYLKYTPAVTLHSRNWRRLVFTAMVVAQKVGDDRALKNSEFPKAWACICKHNAELVSTKTINAMEASFVTAMHFDLFVSSKAYISTFIEICALANTLGQVAQTSEAPGRERRRRGRSCPPWSATGQPK